MHEQPTVHAWEIREANRFPPTHHQPRAPRAPSQTYTSSPIPIPPSICSINSSASVVFTAFAFGIFSTTPPTATSCAPGCPLSPSSHLPEESAVSPPPLRLPRSGRCHVAGYSAFPPENSAPLSHRIALHPASQLPEKLSSCRLLSPFPCPRPPSTFKRRKSGQKRGRRQRASLFAVFPALISPSGLPGRYAFFASRSSAHPPEPRHAAYFQPTSAPHKLSAKPSWIFYARRPPPSSGGVSLPLLFCRALHENGVR